MTSLKSDTDTFISGIFADIDAKNAEGFASRLSENARMRIGSQDPIFGPAAVVEGLSGFFQMIKALQHETVEVWEDGDTLIVESEVTYTRLDDSQITVPAVSILRRGPERIDDYRIFIDLGPVFA
ncbi:nuclear transport factor 2 family protein [Solirubrobacter phytolaccae]|uniref:Nuclear transport factor 2 family protein n=1 Tax=Solirubrobacter phytolaccae TaxID=1404360 RepID=A0A9X3N8E1_9ACTN|nr:nuclear transport factor 2 family protein [Solirubrobacter phytolaccae]MDA0181688.1 nuclear transport factor 2 family protein [Solirubrobacter phytolaccae]